MVEELVSVSGRRATSEKQSERRAGHSRVDKLVGQGFSSYCSLGSSIEAEGCRQ